MTGSADEVLALLRAWELETDPSPLIIETSGSTGQPKRVLLSRSAMRASVHATHERLGGPGTWVLNLPPTYVAGVQVLYRSILAGPSPSRSYISVVPTQLVRMRERWSWLTSYDAVLVGGGPLRPEVRAEAEAAGIRIVQTYGMSETAGGCVYDGRPLDGVDVRIKEGLIQLKGPMLFDGYDGEPERTLEAFDDGWLITNDLGHLDESGRLWVDGRADDVIISGGVKVPAAAVAAMLGPDVHVVGVPDEEWGERVVAVVAGSATLEDLRDRVQPRAWAPRQLVLVDEIPLLSNGKPDRQAMKKLAKS